MTEEIGIKRHETSVPATGPWIYAAIFLIALFIRVNGLDAISSLKGDEAVHVASASNYTERGYFGPDNWYHPPLKHILLYFSIRLFGDNPYGWRLRNVLFGSATVVVLFFLARMLFNSQAIPFICSGLLLLDPLHIMISRSTFEDAPAIFFLLAGLHFAFLAVRHGRDRDWIFSGVLFGLSIASRWYCLPVLMIALFTAGLRAYRKSGVPGLARPLSCLAVLPFLVYLSVFIPWFLKGYSLGEWALMQSDAFREMRHLSAQNFLPILNELGGPANWFIRTIAVGFNLRNDGVWGSYIVIMNNLPVWIFVLPAVVFLLFQGAKERDQNAVVIGLSFCALYIPFLLLDRPIFLYTGLAPLPFGFIALGYAAERLLKRKSYLFLIIASAWSLLLYPLVVGISVPVDLYQPILSHIKIFRPL